MANLKDLKRLCDTYENCSGCPFGNTCCGGSLSALPDNANEIIDKWVSEHPIKTYMQDFFEKFPNAKKNKNGFPTSRGAIICRKELYGDELSCWHCLDCWNQEMKEE